MTESEARSDLTTRVRAEAAEHIRGWYRAAVSADVLIEEVAPIFEAGLLPQTTSTDDLQAEAWREGALWAAVECGAISDESEPWLAPGDNPYEKA